MMRCGCPGRRIRVLNGLLKGLAGVVVRWDGELQFLEVELLIFGRTTQACVELWNVEVIE